MIDHLITVPADQMGAADFLRMVTGRPPLTASDIAKREQEVRAFWEQRHREFEEETARIRARTQELLAYMKERKAQRG